MRAMRSTLPFEDREALLLTARAAKSLPPEKLPRLKVVWAKALAVGPTAQPATAAAAPEPEASSPPD